MIKGIVLFSNGLDSRLVVKILQEQGIDVIALMYKLPFSKDETLDAKKFCEKEGCELKIIDCCHGQLLQKYLKMLVHPKYGVGAGINPCIDCKIFILEHAKDFAEKNNIEIIATGEVIGERPMSQRKGALDLIEEKSELKDNLLRPLSAKLLPETNVEKRGLVDREKFFDIQGRKRNVQMELAEKYNIDYPIPAGGCLLCEPFLKKRIKFALEKGVSKNEVKLLVLGRHFLIEDSWIVLGKNKKENERIEKIGKNIGRLYISKDIPGPSTLVLGDISEERIKELMLAYSKDSDLKDREKFKKYGM